LQRKRATDLLPIGELARRTGLSVSAIRFYEAKGLVTPRRNASGHRRFPRSDIRRLSFILIAQQLGLSIAEIRAAFATLPQGRTPTLRDWSKISRAIQDRIAAQIQALARMRDTLDGCIGCGCLSLRNCVLYNADDRIAARGSGPRILLGDDPQEPQPL
jgi:MerR family redox-sensitive transcriptional activator SoxR